MSYISLGVNFNVSGINFLQVSIIEHSDKGFLSHCIIYKTPELDTNRRPHEPWISPPQSERTYPRCNIPE